MAGFVSVVNLSTGLVSECLPDLPTLDLPRTLRTGASEVSVDGVGLLHFAGAGGTASMERMAPRPVSLRTGGEEFLICCGTHDQDENGWQVYRVCVREP